MPFLNLALFMICFFSLSTFEKIFLLIRQNNFLLVVCSFSRWFILYVFLSQQMKYKSLYIT